jgi:predicted O-methyltransferase YrrM
MPFFWKIKKISFLYKIKINIRLFKQFIYQTYLLIKTNSKIIIVLSFIKNFIISFDSNKDFIKKIYNEKNFSYDDWFTIKISTLIYYLNQYKFNSKMNALEIGSFEGRSSIFFVNYFNDINLTCVDTWEKSVNESDIKMQESIDFRLVEKNFDNNIKSHSSVIKKYKSTSKNFFENSNLQNLDFIFIDGSHKYEDVIHDAIASFKLLKVGGFILFDDLNWFYYKDLKENPSYAINQFLKKFETQIEIIFASNQLLIKKKLTNT